MMLNSVEAFSAGSFLYTPSPANIRDNPSGNLLFQTRTAEYLTVRSSNNVDAGGYTWIPVSARGYSNAWVASHLVYPPPYPPGVCVRASGVNIRSKPSVSGTILAVSQSGDVNIVRSTSPQYVSADGYDWVPVYHDPSGVSGWMASALIDFRCPVQPGVLGVDVSSLVSQSSYSCMLQQGYTTVVARAYKTTFSVDTNAHLNIQAARAAGFTRTGVYLFFRYTALSSGLQKSAVTQVNEAIDYLNNNGVIDLIDYFWVDVEGDPGVYYSTDIATNRAFFKSTMSQLTSRLQNFGAADRIGVYTNKNFWNVLMGETYTAGAIYPLWYASYNNPPAPNFNNFVRFGGWGYPLIKQYDGTYGTHNPQVCGISVDLNYQEE